MPAARGQTRQTGRKKIESIHWPVDGTGQPLAQISFTVSELIPTGDYANVTVGPVTVTRFVSDGDPEHLKDECNKIADAVEMSLSEQREIVHENLKASVEARTKGK